MKVMLHDGEDGKLMVYVAKKDLEEEVVTKNVDGDTTVMTLANGWELSFDGLSEPLNLPQTVRAKRLN
ncbi:putative nitrogen fixation protein NifT [Oscillatoria sp. CS-180]|uniref:putative nitrogen fixation protein NifT n=1 Tax=Oscillatoria sp. CS-180 TaxID=3021720 RepID=UPI00232D46BF|nr:putative nitrogen fixation protein NifT [Oscillatoria sp. CS-180]MDB9525443.1 putative nitrogen fixation protein NifT [Oscillatoria sp. CS-180]